MFEHCCPVTLLKAESVVSDVPCRPTFRASNGDVQLTKSSFSCIYREVTAECVEKAVFDAWSTDDQLTGITVRSSR